jgi:hypothetical protein
MLGYIYHGSFHLLQDLLEDYHLLWVLDEVCLIEDWLRLPVTSSS